MRRHAGWAISLLASSGLILSLMVGASEEAGAQVAAKSATAKAPAPKPPAKPKGDAGASDSGATTSTAPDGGAAVAAAPATTDAGAPAPASTTATPTAGGGSTMDGPTYAVRLRDLESRVDQLKDQIRRSHTRLSLLSDTILSGGASGSRSEVIFHNEMSSAFKLIKALFVIDGAVQYNKQDETGALSDQKEIPIFTGSVPPGDHTVQVSLQFQGNGYGVFTYLRGYKFDVKSSHSFTSVEGKQLTLIATALEKGGVTTPLEQRPGIEWQEKLGPLGGSGGASAPAPAGSAKADGSSVSGGVSVGGGK